MIITDEFLPLSETIAPTDQAALAATVQEMVGRGTPIYPIGGGTRLDYGTRPSRPGIGLSLAELNCVVDHAADDMTITVEAGITIGDLARRLAGERQRLPLDVPAPESATIGGVVATNLVGPRRYAHGTIRDYVIGIRAIDGRGQPFSGGGRVVKNAAGYDLCRLMVGTLGTLGVITQVTLMVRPMPEASAVVACDVPDFETAERLLAELVRTKTLPSAIELQAGSGRPEHSALGPLLGSSRARLLVGFEGTEGEVDWMVGQLRDEWGSLGISSMMTLLAAEANLLWNWLTDFRAEVQISVRPGATVETIERVLQLDPNSSIQAQAGNGVIRVRLSSLPRGEFAKLLADRLRPMVAASDGKTVVLSSPEGVELRGDEIWGPPGDGAAVMCAIKDRFDPEGLLNPGRFIDGNR